MIVIDNFYFSYKRNNVLAAISAKLLPGHIYGILGKNGTGKSTLLYNIAGLLYPKHGSITVNGFAPHKREPRFLSEVFMVPEEFNLPNISIRAFLKYHSPFYSKFDHEAFVDYLRLFEIPFDSKLQGLSYGQKKKVFIAFGVATNASVLLMDEPTNGLDIVSKSQFRKVISMALAPEKTILISSHQVKDLENLIDEVIILNESEIVLSENLDVISTKLSFSLSLDELDPDEVIYSEAVLRGNIAVTRNIHNEEGKVDLELLYKATMFNPTKLKSALN
ncbi:MAG: ABC transporter ATP-binding protein [Chryseolinea sp.]